LFLRLICKILQETLHVLPQKCPFSGSLKKGGSLNRVLVTSARAKRKKSARLHYATPSKA
jgi:hypothetical protein